MLVQLLRCTRYLAKAMVLEDDPRRLAFAMALGMVVGVVPKGNLTAVLLMLVILSLRVNLVAVFLSAILFSVFAATCDPICHLIGGALLNASIFRPLWSLFFNLPLAQWTALNNTVVLGSLVLSIYLFYPTYLANYMAIEGLQPWIRVKFQRVKIIPLLTSMTLLPRLKKV